MHKWHIKIVIFFVQKYLYQYFRQKYEVFEQWIFLIKFIKNSAIILLGRNIPSFFYKENKIPKTSSLLWLFMQRARFVYFFVLKKVGRFLPKILWFVRATTKNGSIWCGTCLLQPYKSSFIMEMIKELEAYEIKNHWTMMKKSELYNKHRKIYWEINTVSPIWSFKRKRLPDRRLMKHKYWLWDNVGMKQGGG